MVRCERVRSLRRATTSSPPMMIGLGQKKTGGSSSGSFVVLEEFTMIGIYRILNNVNGKVYIGQSTNIKRRWKDHINELRRGTHLNNRLQDAWDTFGESAFSFNVLEKCKSNKLNELERYYIKQYDSTNTERGYNISPGIGRNLIDPKRIARDVQNKSVIIITSSDEINSLCKNCDYSCKQSEKNEIVMCKKIAENL